MRRILCNAALGRAKPHRAQWRLFCSIGSGRTNRRRPGQGLLNGQAPTGRNTSSGGHRLIRPGQTSPGMPQQTAPLPPERQSLRSLRLGGACRRRFRKDGCGLTTEGRGIAKESGRRTEAGAGTAWQQGDGLSRRQALYCGGTTAGRRETNSRRAPGKNAPAPPAACGQSRRQGPFPQPANAPVMRRTAVSFMAERFVILTTSPVWGEWMNLPSPT